MRRRHAVGGAARQDTASRRPPGWPHSNSGTPKPGSNPGAAPCWGEIQKYSEFFKDLSGPGLVDLGLEAFFGHCSGHP